MALHRSTNRGTYTFSRRLPRRHVAALPPHVLALFLKLARDRSADAQLRYGAKHTWRDAEKRAKWAERKAQDLFGMRGLGFYLEGSLASAWNPATGWLAAAGWRKGEPGAWLSIRPKEPVFTEDGSPVVLIAQRNIDRGGRRIRPGDILVVDAPIGRELVESATTTMTQLVGQVQWSHRWEPGQTFSGVSRWDALPMLTTLTRAQLRHVPTARSWVRERYEDALLRPLDRWIAERLPGNKSHGRRPLFTKAWWTFADWVYRHYGKRELNTEIADKLAACSAKPPDESYISRKQHEFIVAGGLLPISPPSAARANARWGKVD